VSGASGGAVGTSVTIVYGYEVAQLCRSVLGCFRSPREARLLGVTKRRKGETKEGERLVLVASSHLITTLTPFPDLKTFRWSVECSNRIQEVSFAVLIFPSASISFWAMGTFYPQNRKHRLQTRC
jgi:hypothetical protein